MKILEYLVPPATQEQLAAFKSRQNTTKISLMSFKPDNTNPSNSFQVSNHKNTNIFILTQLPLHVHKFFNDSMLCGHTISITYIDVAFSTP